MNLDSSMEEESNGPGDFLTLGPPEARAAETGRAPMSAAATPKTGVSMKSSARSSKRSISSTSRRSEGSAAQAASRKRARSAGSRSNACSNSSSTCRQRSDFILTPLGNRTVQPSLRAPSLAPDGRRRDAQDLRRLLDPEAREVAQGHDPRLLRVNLLQPAQR